jgi:hypothetical protein
MYGLTVRWSLQDAPEGVADKLREYVTGTSLERFAGMPDLCFKVWRMVPGDWFEGTYVFDTDDARDAFLAGFEEQAPTAPGTLIIGSAPVLMAPYEVVAVAEGDAGFVPGPGPGSS